MTGCTIIVKMNCEKQKSYGLNAYLLYIWRKYKRMSLSCKLTSAELRLRKETIIKQLKENALERTETGNGFAYKFEATDSLLDRLIDFIKTERQCCDFFDFDIRISSGNIASLEIAGPTGAKDFIVSELDM